MSNYKISVLGGIGSNASAYFYTEVIKRIQQKVELEDNGSFPHMLLENINVPFEDIVEPTRPTSPAAFERIYESVSRLANFTPDIAVMVCNTIHLYYDQIVKETGINNLVFLPDVVKNGMNKEDSYCIMASGLTRSSGMYKFDDYNYTDLTDEEQGLVWKAICEYNLSYDRYKVLIPELKALLDKKRAEGATCFLYSCTEVSEVMREVKGDDYLDTLELLIDYVVDKFVAQKK